MRDAYCSYCGTKHVDEKYPKKCPACKTEVWDNPKFVSIILVPFIENPAELLLVRRNIEPHIGELGFPGGFIETGETWQEAGRREVWEECNIEINAAIKLISIEPTPLRTLNLMFGLSMPISKNLLLNFKPNHETQELVVGNINSKLCFPLHQKILEQYYK